MWARASVCDIMTSSEKGEQFALAADGSPRAESQEGAERRLVRQRILAWKRLMWCSNVAGWSWQAMAGFPRGTCDIPCENEINFYFNASVSMSSNEKARIQRK